MSVELHCLSNFSFLRGASHPEELVERACELGYSALAITDECSVSGVVRAHLEARSTSLRLIIGSEFLFDDLCLVLLATNRAAYAQLCRLITRARRRAEKGSYAITLEDFLSGLNECLLLVIPDFSVPVEQPGTPQKSSSTKPLKTPAQIQQALPRLRDAFSGRIWIGVERHLREGERQHFQWLRHLGQEFNVPLAACGGVRMHARQRQSLADVLAAIRLGVSVQQLGNAAESNAERHLRTSEELARLYPADLLREAAGIAERCTFSLEELRYEYPQELVPEGLSPNQYLRQLVEAGMQQRWPGGTDGRIRQMIEHELALIAEMRYEHYFITVYDIVRFARSRNILCQGRGSAANSAVCFCLGITEVDPARIEVLFERFISKERDEPPDIDVDFEHERREEVIQYIYTKYGRQRSALTATVITYRSKSAVRDVGKALGFELSLVEQLSNCLAWWDKPDGLKERLRGTGLQMDTVIASHFLRLVQEIRGFPRHLSQHVGGFLVSQGPIDEMVPIENASMPDRTVIQWDKDDLDTLGLLKIDVLALGMLTAIRKAVTYINTVRGTQLEVGGIPAEDPKVYEMIQRADTVGVFQIESRAQMSMLPRLKPACFYDLVIEVAIVRPGPIQGEMVHPYLRRRAGLEAVEYASEDVRGVLERTLGVPIFQEQVIKLAMVAAGFTPGEADQLRRAMAAWKRKGGLEAFEQKLISGMRERGYDGQFAQQIVQQIRGFGEYGFPESHAASFALLVYVSAWLKCHEPAAFYAGILNSLPMGFYSPSQLVQDARRHNIEVRSIDVCYSQWDCSLEPPSKHGKQPALRLGFRLVNGIGKDAGERMVSARTAKRFSGMEDLTRRADLNRHELEALADADTFRTLAGHRHDALWDVQGVQAARPLLPPQVHEAEGVYLQEPTPAQEMIADYRSTGLTLGAHPLRLLQEHPLIRRCVKSSHLAQLSSGSMVRVAGLVTGRQRPGTASGVVFLSLEDDTGTTNVIVWKNTFEAQRKAIVDATLLHVTGTLEIQERVIHVIAGRLEDHSHLLDTLEIHARNFH